MFTTLDAVGTSLYYASSAIAQNTIATGAIVAGMHRFNPWID